MRYLLPVLFALPLCVAGQSPQVPHKLDFAGITLTIRDDARREIQKDVDALTRSPRHFNIKAERAKTYFPIIERVFAEERLPDDFKYLVLQESALIPDAVSVSQAVGFWQFKDFTAVEMGLRVDREVDERMNIVSSSRAAARYMKKNNFYFNNWLHALQAYQMGAGGAMKAIKEDKGGTRHMEITSKTYWYVKKFLAHMIAFEGAMDGPVQVAVATLPSSGHKSLREVAKAASIPEEELLTYNKWVRKNGIPDDKEYAILVPVNDNTKDYLIAARAIMPGTTTLASRRTPDQKPEPVAAAVPAVTSINGVPAMAARAGETASAFAKRADIRVSSFLKYNDIGSRQKKLVTGTYYFTSRKRSRAETDYHKLAEGESLWEVSQKYGIRLNRLLRFNRLSEGSSPEAGTTLYLSSRKPKGGDTRTAPQDVLEVDSNSLFAWSADPSTGATVSSPPARRHEAPARSTVGTSRNDQPVFDDPEDNESQQPEAPANIPTVVMEDTSSGQGEKSPADRSATGAAGEHEVLPGETLYGISNEYDVEVMDLVRWNDLDLDEGIKPGQVLKLQGEAGGKEAAPSASEIIHEVRASDTLYSVARKYGVSIKELMEWNQKSDFNIHVGEKLKVLAR